MADRPIPKPQELYRHFKDKEKLYQIITIARHSETDEDMVVYQALYGDYGIYVRPLDMFMSLVDREKYPDAKSVYRFEKVENQYSYADKKKTDKNIDTGIITNVELCRDENTGQSVNNTNENGQYTDDVTEQASGVSSDLIAFLDAETYEQQRNLLIHMRPRMSDRLIDDIAASMDVTVEDGDLDTRYQSLLNCIKTREKYEILDRH